MPGNINPIFTKVGDIQWSNVNILTANTTRDGTGANVIYTADATNGGYVDSLRIKARGTNTATVLRIFINNGGALSTNTNNILFGEVGIAGTTASETAPTVDVDYPMGIAMPPGYTIAVAIGTSVAAGLSITVIGGKY